jgi:hypothetical protein
MLSITDDHSQREFTMRRMMHSLIVTAIFASPAIAQCDSSVIAIGSRAPCVAGGCASPVQSPTPTTVSGCSTGTSSQLAAYMNSFPGHPDLWSSYPAEYNERLGCLYKHLNGCDCLDPKRKLHSHPSMVGSHGGACQANGCDPTASTTAAKPSLFQRTIARTQGGFSQLNSVPSSPASSGPLINHMGAAKQPAATATVVAQTPTPVAPPVQPGVVIIQRR